MTSTSMPTSVVFRKLYRVRRHGHLIFFFLSRSNILGHKGEVAEEFGAIMKALWSGQFKFISPRDFKITIGKINDQFSGYEQQDSQELLLFLMDGLHEDLNKVTAAQEL